MNIIPMTILDIVTDLAILGAILVSFGYPLYANMIWIITNPYLIYHNRKINQPEQAKMFVIYTLICAFGIWNLWSL